MSEQQPTLEIFFDFSSPFSYLACTQVEAVCARTGAALTWKPMFLGGVFKAIEGPMVPIQTFPEAKRTHYMLDLHRWAEDHGVPFTFPSRFPMMTVAPLRVVTLLEGEEQSRFIHAVNAAYWSQDRNISDKGVLAELLSEQGLSPELLIQTADPEVKQRLQASTEEAVSRGVFGAPALFVNGDLMFWGQDRLDFVEKALKGWRPSCG